MRLSFPDQHGILRGKTIVAGDAAKVMRNGCSITTTLLAKDTSHKTVFPVFTAGGGFGMPEMEGGGDFLMIADPTTFRVLPWAPQTGWVLCDIYFQNGKPVPFSTRHLYRQVLNRLGDAGFDYVAGLEVEFHVFKIENPRLDPADAGWPSEPPEVSVLSSGYQYLTETRFDQLEPVLETIRRDVVALDLPLRSVEIELGPSQCEFTFQTEIGLAPADTMMLFRSAVKQICRRQGYHASFMCRPKLPNVMSSGWHLHQSLRNKKHRRQRLRSRRTTRCCRRSDVTISRACLAHARGAAAFTTPTINGYKRYRQYTLAPDRVIWGRDNRGVMLRVIGGAGDAATRIENRVGEPSANPYLYMASQIVCGLDGVEQQARARAVGRPALRDGRAVPAEEPRRGADRVARGSLPRRRASARASSTISSASSRASSRATRPRSRTGSSASISSCSDASSNASGTAPPACGTGRPRPTAPGACSPPRCAD